MQGKKLSLSLRPLHPLRFNMSLISFMPHCPWMYNAICEHRTWKLKRASEDGKGRQRAHSMRAESHIISGHENESRGRQELARDIVRRVPTPVLWPPDLELALPSSRIFWQLHQLGRFHVALKQWRSPPLSQAFPIATSLQRY